MIVVGTTVAPWKCNGNETAWLDTAEQMIADVAPLDTLTFFVAFEFDSREGEPFTNLAGRLGELVSAGAEFFSWGFRLWDGVDVIDGQNRLPRICAGRNFVQDFALKHDASHILFLDTDIRPPGDCISKLLALGWPMVGGNVGSYGLHGKPITQRPNGPAPGASDLVYDFPVQRHWNTAGFLLVEREVFRQVRWRIDGDVGMSDDPCYDADATRLGYPTLVRKDVNAEHVEPLVPVERRPEELRRIIH